MPENKRPGEGISLVVLAGGRSSRMGSDKSDLPIGESTLSLIHILGLFAPLPLYLGTPGVSNL